MDEPDIAPPPAAEAPVIQQRPEAKTVYLGGLFLFALLTVIYVANSIILPAILAVIMKMVFQPIMRYMQKLYVPQTIAAFIIILALLSIFIGLGTALSGPSMVWVEKLPSGIPKLQQHLKFLKHPIAKAQQFMDRADGLTKGPGPEVVPVAIQGTLLSDKLFNGVRSFASELFTTLLLLFFLLASGDTFLRRLVEILPRFKDKRQAVDITQNIEIHISSYLITISIINAGVGITTGIVMMACGIPDPILWGTLAFLLNYIPIIGPLIGVGIFLLAGLLTIDIGGMAFIPAGLYMLIHMAESTFITPMLLAKRFTLNPVMVILSLIFWYWMWGVPGAILSMPMLAITKIICDRIQPLMALGHFLEG